MAELLEMKAISKSFFGVKVLNNINFHVKAGTVHALCGENGAGKSTLMKILAGIYSCEDGEIELKGEKMIFHNPSDAIRHGIAMIHQELAPVRGMKVSENIFLGREPGRAGLIDYREMNRRAEALLQEMNCDIKAGTRMGELKVADMQLVEIAKAVLYDSDILIMDEPTSALTDREVNILFDVIDKLKKQGKGIIYISHKMDEVMHLSDELTILRDGEYIGTWKASDITLDEIMFHMVGRKLDAIYPARDAHLGDTVFEVKELCQAGRYYDVNFSVRRGEILGIVGLMGAGRTEVMETLFGMTRRDSGTVLFKGEPLDFRHTSEAYRKAIAFVTEDRKRFGLIPGLSIMQNIILSSMKLITKCGFILNKKSEQTVVQDIYDKLQIRSRDTKQPVRTISGGNQQKVVLARALLTRPELLILDEPTRGIDVGAKHEIYKIMNDFVAEGNSIILISSELPEVIGMSDRIIVFSNKTVTGEMDKEHFDQTELLRLAMANL